MSSTPFAIANYEDEVQNSVEDNPFTVFLCGPTLQDLSIKSSAALRQLLLEAFRKEGFTVVLGEDDGLMDLQEYLGGDAQSTELGFVKNHADAVVLIADSSGSFSELGLFAHFHSSSKCNFSFALVVDEFFRDKEMYVSLGPVKLVESRGKVVYVKFKGGEDCFGEIVSELIADLNVQRFRSLME